MLSVLLLCWMSICIGLDSFSKYTRNDTSLNKYREKENVSHRRLIWPFDNNNKDEETTEARNKNLLQIPKLDIQVKDLFPDLNGITSKIDGLMEFASKTLQHSSWFKSTSITPEFLKKCLTPVINAKQFKNWFTKVLHINVPSFSQVMDEDYAWKILAKIVDPITIPINIMCSAKIQKLLPCALKLMTKGATTLTCPANTKQVGPKNADITGCGLEGCNNRGSDRYPNIDKCAETCIGKNNCKSFTWAPNEFGKTVCTLYGSDEYTQIYGHQIMCKPLHDRRRLHEKCTKKKRLCTTITDGWKQFLPKNTGHYHNMMECFDFLTDIASSSDGNIVEEYRQIAFITDIIDEAIDGVCETICGLEIVGRIAATIPCLICEGLQFGFHTFQALVNFAVDSADTHDGNVHDALIVGSYKNMHRLIHNQHVLSKMIKIAETGSAKITSDNYYEEGDDGIVVFKISERSMYLVGMSLIILVILCIVSTGIACAFYIKIRSLVGQIKYVTGHKYQHSQSEFN
eukprot:346516_1